MVNGSFSYFLNYFRGLDLAARKYKYAVEY